MSREKRLAAKEIKELTSKLKATEAEYSSAISRHADMIAHTLYTRMEKYRTRIEWLTRS